MSEVVLKRRPPLEVVKYILEKLERAEVKRGGFPLLIHQALEAVDAASAERSGLRELLDGVLYEAGLQAHSVGCPNRLMRTRVSRGTVGPCRGCAAEAALASGEESRDPASAEPAEEPGR